MTEPNVVLPGIPRRAKGIYRHYKGGIYLLVSVSLMEDTLDPVVTYRSLADERYWCRSLVSWDSHVIIDNKTVPRFEFLGDYATP